jgi:hypothetical protein
MAERGKILRGVAAANNSRHRSLTTMCSYVRRAKLS